MKRFTITIALLLAAWCTYAQKTITVSKTNVNPNSIVKDSTGVLYPYAMWQKLVSDGDYWLKSLDITDPDGSFLLVKYTEQQKNARYSQMSIPNKSPFFKTGETIKPFKIKDINGKKIEAADWAGKTVVINFWFIGCPPCRAEIPELNKLAEKYKNNPNVLFIGLALDRDADVKFFLQSNPFNYTQVGNAGYYSDLFKVTLYPTNVVIDKEGKVRFHYVSSVANGPYWMDRVIQESENIKL